jgi:hypothetical protein
MQVKGVIFEDFVNYKIPCMTIESPFCTFKCDKECGKPVCQNSPLVSAETLDIKINDLIEQYLENKITKAICFQGLEPFDTWEETYDFIFTLRRRYHCKDDVVIYTGFTEEELKGKLIQLSMLENIIIKFGRFVPDQEKHFDEVLGVELASPNQYARRIS